ncbi:MAG: hypothetical protein NPIRA02_01960 [Nitrospirales bacterium]|nr:MAG: hypothetical protein NPIRA02_01960 [Nitrospirales bacterium]
MTGHIQVIMESTLAHIVNCFRKNPARGFDKIVSSPMQLNNIETSVLNTNVPTFLTVNARAYKGADTDFGEGGINHP